MNPGHIRGMLLEEAVLHLLRRSGYRTINAPGTDPTLCNVGAGLAIHGRGSKHQVDAIADFLVHQPFSNPQRLMVEAKCYGSDRRVGIDTVRNAIGVLKDTSEFWVAGPSSIAGLKRYHYQYAVFSASAFTGGAQCYAFAQDIYLFPLGRSRYFQPILNAIRQIGSAAQRETYPTIITPRQLSHLRSFVRKSLDRESILHEQVALAHESAVAMIPFLNACRNLDYALVAVLGGRFPVLLSPSSAVQNSVLEDQVRVRIYWDNRGWYIRDKNNKNLFSFDLPDDLFKLYAEDGFLTQGRALDMKEEMMSTFQIVEWVDGHARLIKLVLDHDWIEAIRRRME